MDVVGVMSPIFVCNKGVKKNKHVDLGGKVGFFPVSHV